jgi:hypothetical protein
MGGMMDLSFLGTTQGMAAAISAVAGIVVIALKVPLRSKYFQLGNPRYAKTNEEFSQLRDTINSLPERLDKIERTNEHQEKQIEELRAGITKCEMASNRQILRDENSPIEERLIAGWRYVKAGGNNKTKTLFYKLVKENQDVWNKLTVEEAIGGDYGNTD